MISNYRKASKTTLSSAAMLNAVYKTTHQDLLDSLLPFVKVAIGKSRQIGSEIKATEITSILNRDFGFSSIPYSVTKILLKRLSPSTLEKRQDKYYLKQDLSEEIKKFDRAERKQDDHCREVGEALSKRIQSMRGGTKLNPSEALDYLLLFFETHGLSIAENPKYINSLTSNKKASYEYQVGQFILEEHEGKTALFDYISEILKGFFLSLAISLHSQSSGSGRAKLKDTACYLDTRLILDILGCNTPEDKESSAQMLEMLKEQGARVCVFSHSVSEVDGILNAYEFSLKKPGSNFSHHTLEGFDIKSATWEDVELFRGRMRESMNSLGIEIVSKPSFSSEVMPCVDELGLKDHLGSGISYVRDIALQRDVDSISSVAFFRGDLNPSSIEKCGHIFITSNSRLSRLATEYFERNQDSYAVPLIIDETRFTSLLWLKCYSTHTDYPRMKLIKDALASTAASEDILEAFYREVKLLEENGGITEAEALAMSSHLFNRRELMKLTEGDPEQVGASVVLSVRDNLQKQYGKEAAAVIAKKEEELRSAVARRSDDRSKALDRIRQAGLETRKRWITRLTRGARVLFLLLFLLCLVVIICDVASSNGNPPLVIILSLISGFGLYDSFSSRRSKINALLTRVSQRIADKRMDKLRSDFEAAFGELK